MCYEKVNAPKLEEEHFRGGRSNFLFSQGEFLGVCGLRGCSETVCRSVLSRTQARFAMISVCDSSSVGSFL